MIIPGFIVFYHLPLNALGSHRQRDVDDAVRPRFRGKDSEFHCRQGCPGIPVRHVRQKFQRVVVDGGVIGAHALLLIGQSPPDQSFDVLPAQRLQFEDHGPGEERPVDLKIRILGGGSDQDDGPVLHVGEQIILLPLVEAVDLVDEEDRPPAIHPLQLLRLLHHGFHILFPGRGGIDLSKTGAGGVGDHSGQRRLPGARRPVEDDGADLIRLDGPVEQLILSYDMLLPHHLVQGLRPQPGGQWGLLFSVLCSHVVK